MLKPVLSLLILYFFFVSLTSCSQDFTRGDNGIEYKITKLGSGAKLKNGNFMQIHIAQLVDVNGHDTILKDTRKEFGPSIEIFDRNNVPPEYFKILSQMRKGDSLTMRILNDTLLARSNGKMPDFFQKGKYFTTTVKLLNIFTDVKQADSARDAELVKYRQQDSIESIKVMANDDKVLQDYFKKNNISVQKAPQGTYVQIIEPGNGPAVDTNIIASVNYTGRTMDGIMFDSNTDSSKGHVEPFQVNMTTDPSLGAQVIKGWTDGISLLRKGSKAKFYIPSPLAYGKRGAGEDIKPNSILVFDIEIVDLLSRETVKAELNQKLLKMKQRQEKMKDSIEQKRKTDSINKSKQP